MRFSYAESMTDPSYYLPLARAAEEAGFDSMVVPDSICYPEESDAALSVQSRRHPGVPRRQTVPRALLPDPGHGGGHRDPALHHVRPEAPHPPPRAGGQAGRLDRRAHRQPPPARRGDEPVARGLRRVRRALGGPGQADGRADRRAARPARRRVLRVPRRGVRRPVHQDEPHAHQAGADPDRRASRGGPAPGRPGRGRVAARGRGSRRPARPARSA